MKIYSANYRCNTNLITALIALLQQAKTYQWQIRLAISTKIKATYQQDVFSLFWSIIMPIMPMIVYMILAHIKVFKTVDDMPYIYYIAMGMLVWLLMATMIHTVMLSIKADKAILTTTSFPIFATMLSHVGEVLHDTTIRLIVVTIIIIFYQINVDVFSLLLAILSLIPVIIFAFGIGMLMSLLDIVVQDTRRVMVLVLRYGLFISSVIFPFPEGGIPGMLNKFNFFNTYVNSTRDLLYHGKMDDISLYLCTSAVGVIVFLIAAKLVYTMDYKIRAYL